MSLFSDILAALGSVTKDTPIPASGLVGDIIAAIPEIESSIADALQNKGYTNQQIDAIFADIVPYDSLGINPNHPFAPDPAVTPTPAAPAGQMHASQVHISARPGPLPPPEQPVTLAPFPSAGPGKAATVPAESAAPVVPAGQEPHVLARPNPQPQPVEPQQPPGPFERAR